MLRQARSEVGDDVLPSVYVCFRENTGVCVRVISYGRALSFENPGLMIEGEETGGRGLEGCFDLVRSFKRIWMSHLASFLPFSPLLSL